MKKLYLYLFTSILLIANDTNIDSDIDKDVQKIFQDVNQKAEFKKITNTIDYKENTYYKLKPIELVEEQYEEECIEIEKITIVGSTIFKDKDFFELKKPYINECDGIKKLNNFANKVTNMYIRGGYVTSKAYIKIQDLSDGEIVITILEGKIDKVVSTDIYVGNTYKFLEDKILNLRDLEVGIQSHEKLKSQKLSLELIPSSKLAYTNIIIRSKKDLDVLRGSVTLNNYSSKEIGQYQILTSLSYDNPFNINDIISASVSNTNRMFKSNNKSSGYSLSYAFPLLRNYFNITYSSFKYNQIVKNTLETVSLNGTSNAYGLKYTYNIFHDKKNNVKFNLNYNNTKSENFKDEYILYNQSSTTQSISGSIQHSYKTNMTSYYLNFSISSVSKKSVEDNSQTNYSLDLSYSTYPKKKSTINFTSLFHIVSSKKQKFGAGQIGVGGPYSVRGFKGNGISGYVGGFLRNELSFTDNIGSFIYKPFIGLDAGYIKEEEEYVNPGTIVGSSLGFNLNYNSQSFKTYFNKALKHTEETELNDTNKNFVGFEYTYAF